MSPGVLVSMPGHGVNLGNDINEIRRRSVPRQR